MVPKKGYKLACIGVISSLFVVKANAWFTNPSFFGINVAQHGTLAALLYKDGDFKIKIEYKKTGEYKDVFNLTKVLEKKGVQYDRTQHVFMFRGDDLYMRTKGAQDFTLIQ